MFDMISYSVQMLSNVAVFLRSEPMIYVFGFILLVFMVKIFLFFIPKT